MKKAIFTSLAVLALVLSGCGGKGKDKGTPIDQTPISLAVPAKGDSTIYGLACDGCTDSVVVLLPNAGGDPVTYNIIDARRHGRVFGSPQIGDWLGVVPDPHNKRIAHLVVDLDEVKGSWTHTVMPTLRDVQKMTRREAREAIAAMPDSVKETYMIPREYGFTLKRQSQASPIGFVRQTADEESPVVYPKVPIYTEWHAFNGRLILVQGRMVYNGVVLNEREKRDTLDFVYMKDDSLVLRDRTGDIVSLHRVTDAHQANARANAAADKIEQQSQQKLK